MNIKRATLASAVVIAASAGVGVWAFVNLPAGALIAVHFNAHGDPDGYVGKALGLTLMPAIGATVIALLALLLQLAPRRRNLAASAGALGTVILGVATIFLVAQVSIVAQALDPAFDILRSLFVAIGVLLAVVGNLLGKVRHNYVLGVRTPWTLANERVWDKTHRYTGRLMTAAGVVLALGAALVADHRIMIALLVVCASGPPLAGFVYSWRLYRGQSAAAVANSDSLTRER
jgi:uncharacterized membrane protein